MEELPRQALAVEEDKIDKDDLQVASIPHDLGMNTGPQVRTTQWEGY